MSLDPLDLGDHLLWPDGDISVTPDRVIDFVYKLQGHQSHGKGSNSDI